MNGRLRGFATLTALSLLVLLTASLSVIALATSQVELSLHRSVAADQAQAWSRLDHALAALQKTWDPSNQSFRQWAQANTQDSVDWESLSGRVNLNTISPFILALPGFRETLKGVSTEKFVESRGKTGPRIEISQYGDLIDPKALDQWYTVHSLWNLNTADETMLEAMATERFQNSGVGSALRASVRAYREQTKRITASDLAALVQVGGPGLGPITTLEPELDVNEAPIGVIQAFVSNPAWKVNQPDEKVLRIVQERQSKPWTLERLKALLAVPDDNLLLSYLGVRSRFLGGRVSTPSGVLGFVVYLASEGPELSPRILQTTWSAQ